MAAPNLINATTITGKLIGAAVTASGVVVANNPSNSGKCLKVNALYVSNVDGVNNATVDVQVVIAGSPKHITKTLNVPADATIDVISKPLYLEENMTLNIVANVDGDLEAVCSYEEIS
mgnify:CR=1 FL=1